MPAVNLCLRLVISKRTGMSVVLRSSDVFATQKLASRSVHGCTLLDSLFQKAYGKVCFKCCRVCRNAGDTAHLLRCIIKSVHPCTLLMANFGFAEISLLFKPVASVPMFKRQCRLNLQVLLLAKRCCRKSSTYQNAQGRAWFPAIAIFWLCQNSRSKIDKEVNF